MDNKKGGRPVIFCPAGKRRKSKKHAEAAPHRHWVEII
jgi:hypothetical protein